MRRLLGALCVVVAACSGDSETASTTTAESDTTTTTSVVETTTTPTTAAAPCPEPPVPAVTVAMTQAAGDVDGDGTADRLMTYGAGSQDDPSPWHVRVELGAGGGYDGEIADAPGFAPVRVLGAADVSADTSAEPFVVVDSGASTSLVRVFQWGGCELTPLAGTVLPVGGTVTHLDGLVCEDDGLVRLSATSDDGVTYATTRQPLAIVDGGLMPSGPPVVETLVAGEAIGGYASIDCPGVESP